jgi:hypothetical protein
MSGQQGSDPRSTVRLHGNSMGVTVCVENMVWPFVVWRVASRLQKFFSKPSRLKHQPPHSNAEVVNSWVTDDGGRWRTIG